ncbi:hypothetical protein Tco_1418474 [Tanacetum coccineum]
MASRSDASNPILCSLYNSPCPPSLPPLFVGPRISMDLRMDRSSPGKYNSSMVLDFLKGTSLRYALTHNPTIYDSLVKQFWQTATIRTLAKRTQKLVASIDSKEYTITEASVRSTLQLADATGIHNLFDAEIYAGLATLGYVTEGAVVDQGEGSTQPTEPHHTPDNWTTWRLRMLKMRGGQALWCLKRRKVQKKGVSTEDPLSTAQPKVCTDKPEVSTAKPKEVEVSTDKLDEGAKKKGVGDSKMLKIQNSKGLTSTRSIDEAERKVVSLLLKDEERNLDIKMQEDWDEKRNWKRAIFLYDTIAAQKRFLSQQRAAAIRSRPPTRTQLRNQMMTYLKHVGGKKHVDLKNENLKKYKFCIKDLGDDMKNLKSLKEVIKNEGCQETPRGNKIQERIRKRRQEKKTLQRHFKHLKLSMEGDLKIMMESLTKENDQELKDGIVIYMLVERRYPLSKELLQRMLDFGLEVEEESTIALHLASELESQELSKRLLLRVASPKINISGKG